LPHREPRHRLLDEDPARGGDTTPHDVVRLEDRYGREDKR
jgi:hypothetical protein